MVLQSLTQSVFDTDATCGCFFFGRNRVVLVGVMLITFRCDSNLKFCVVFDSEYQECPTHFQDLLMRYNCTKHTHN
jgi:hypothetical protein